MGPASGNVPSLLLLQGRLGKQPQECSVSDTHYSSFPVTFPPRRPDLLTAAAAAKSIAVSTNSPQQLPSELRKIRFVGFGAAALVLVLSFAYKKIVFSLVSLLLSVTCQAGAGGVLGLLCGQWPLLRLASAGRQLPVYQQLQVTTLTEWGQIQTIS